MSGRHKPLMHVIFLFSPAISPAFPHRSLLFPNHFKNGMYFCLRPHALSLLIRGVRFHWDSKHASLLNKLDIPFSPARGCLLTNQVWIGVGTPRVSFREDWEPCREVIDWLQPRANTWVHVQDLLPCFSGCCPWVRCCHAKLALLFPQPLRLPSAQHWSFPPAQDTC